MELCCFGTLAEHAKPGYEKRVLSNRNPWAMQVRARACITRMPTSHPNSMATQHYSIVKYSFPMTKMESPTEDCIVVFLAEKFV